jgi:hypothetical protein
MGRSQAGEHPGEAERRQSWCGLVAVVGLLSTALGACGSARETALKNAAVGDTLVRAGDTTVMLAHAFRPGEPNALLDGAVRVRDGAGERLLEVNAVCSLPNNPGWPAYDNLYGREIERPADAKGSSGITTWQVLFHFAGRQEARMGSSPGPWVARLRDNLCRRGDFDDRPGKR